jgi:transcription initiation factor IIE alpha subunit
MKNKILKHEFDFECPKCKYKNKFTLEQVKSKTPIKCKKCSELITFRDKDNQLNKLVKTLDDFDKSISKLFK